MHEQKFKDPQLAHVRLAQKGQHWTSDHQIKPHWR